MKATNRKANMAEAASVPAPDISPTGRRKKLITLAGLGILLAGGGATGGWFATERIAKSSLPAPVQEKKPAATPRFLTLEPFVVNLQDPGGQRYAQIGVTLQFEDPALETALKERLPAVRNNILLLISSKQVEDLLTTDGKQLLSRQIRGRVAVGLGLEPPAGSAAGKGTPENPVKDVLFSQFIVQ